MRLLVARWSATYEGRLSSTLSSAVRLVMVRADIRGHVAAVGTEQGERPHSDTRAFGMRGRT